MGFHKRGSWESSGGFCAVPETPQKPEQIRQVLHGFHKGPAKVHEVSKKHSKDIRAFLSFGACLKFLGFKKCLREWNESVRRFLSGNICLKSNRQFNSPHPFFGMVCSGIFRILLKSLNGNLQGAQLPYFVLDLIALSCAFFSLTFRWQQLVREQTPEFERFTPKSSKHSKRSRMTAMPSVSQSV